MRRERFERTVRVPVRVRQGRIEFLYEDDMPKLSEGAIGEVIFDENALEDVRWKAPLTAEHTVSIIAEESLVQGVWAALAVRPDRVPDNLKKHLITLRVWRALIEETSTPDEKAHLKPDAPVQMHSRWWVLARLAAPLSLRLRGERPARLQGGACYIPALEKLKQPAAAISLNQALTWVSTNFEPSRHSHTGNVFREVLLQWDGNFDILDDVRGTLEASDETERLRAAGVDPKTVHERAMGGLFG